jgi:SAM-dependent MidA family methyltransferase
MGKESEPEPYHFAFLEPEPHLKQHQNEALQQHSGKKVNLVTIG